MSKYPEHNKLERVSDESQSIGQFLDWIPSRGLVLCKYDEHTDQFYPAHIPINDLLALYFDIDQKNLEQEKREMLEFLRQINEQVGGSNDG